MTQPESRTVEEHPHFGPDCAEEAIRALYTLWVDMGGSTSVFAEAVRQGFANYTGYNVIPQRDSPEDIRNRAAAKEHGLVIGEGELDAAWKETEAALPEGLSLLIGDERSRGKEGWWATASRPFDEVRRGYRIISSSDDSTLYPTPAAALRALAERLRR